MQEQTAKALEGSRPTAQQQHAQPTAQRRAGASKVLNFGRIGMVFRETMRLGLELRLGVGAGQGEVLGREEGVR